MTRDKKIGIAILTVLAALIFPLFFINMYTSSPGFVTPETNEEFYANAKRCIGFSFLLNPEEMAADAPGKSLCVGILK